MNRIVSGKQSSGKPYYLEGRLLKKYIYDNKQRFEVTVVPPNCAAMLLNLAHDQMGHNGSARTYMLLKRLYYVKQCKLCQRQNGWVFLLLLCSSDEEPSRCVTFFYPSEWSPMGLRAPAQSSSLDRHD